MTSMCGRDATCHNAPLPRRSLLRIGGLGLMAWLTAPFSCAAMDDRADQTDTEQARAKQLPKDGSWVRYHWTLSQDNGARERAGSLAISIVGTQVVNQKKHRWVEFSFIYDESGTKQRPVLLKTLVSEAVLKSFIAGKLRDLEPQQRRPAKAWIKVEDNSPKRLEETRGPNDFPFLAGLMDDVSHVHPLAPLRGEIKDARQEIEPKTVEFQKGKIHCKGFRTRSIERLDEGKGQIRTTRSVWVNEAVFLGFAACRAIRKRLVANELKSTKTMTLSLSDFGENAKTALPHQDGDKDTTHNRSAGP